MSPASHTVLRQAAQLELALALLRQGAEHARELGAPLWDFAVEIDRLHAAGATSNDLRRWIRVGLVEHRLETRSLRAPARRFRTIRNLCFTQRSCFVLTPLGQARATPAGRTPATAKGPRVAAAQISAVAASVPRWDDVRRVLWAGTEVVKHFRQPSMRQVAVLTAFETQAWPPRIDNPLPAADADDGRLLHFTIQNLNRNQRRKLLHFSGDGTRRGVCWRFLNE